MTNDTLSLEATAEQVHAAMVWAATEGKGEPQPWQGGNSTAEEHARHIARKIEALRTPTPDTRVEALREARPFVEWCVKHTSGDFSRSAYDCVTKIDLALRSHTPAPADGEEV